MWRTRGGANGTDRTVQEVRPVENVAERPRTRYELNDLEQFEAMSAIEHDGREVVGFYHSHPHGPPCPSGTDRSEAYWQGYDYVIVALGNEPFVGAWRLTGQGLEPQRVTLEGIE